MTVTVRKWQISVAVVCLLLGFLLVLQYRSQLPKTEMNLGAVRLTELAQLYRDSEAERRALRREVDQLRQALVTANAGQHQAAAIVKQLQQTRRWAGLTTVVGPGVEVTVDSGAAPGRGVTGGTGAAGGPGPGAGAGVGAVQDQDLLLLVNELAAAGAEAISINGQRHIATSEIRRAGGMIVSNNVPIDRPYTILAIGDPPTLIGSLRMRGGVVEQLATWGIKIDVAPRDSLTIPAYKGSMGLTYAREP